MHISIDFRQQFHCSCLPKIYYHLSGNFRKVLKEIFYQYKYCLHVHSQFLKVFPAHVVVHMQSFNDSEITQLLGVAQQATDGQLVT